MIVGLRGHKGSGRSTIAAYLMKQHGFERRAFADPLKKSVAETLQIPYYEIDRLKNDVKMWVTVSKQWETDGLETYYSLTFRDFIVHYAQSHKAIFGADVWVNQVLPADGFYAGKKIVIPDIHFDNEAKRIHDIGGFVVNVMIAGVSPESEHRADVDYLLYHMRDTDELYGQIEQMLTSLGNEVRAG